MRTVATVSAEEFRAGSIAKSEAIPREPVRVLVIFGTVALYGMERGVIETFDLLRPEVEAHFLLSQTPWRLGLPVFDEIERRKIARSFLSDRDGWERLARPRSITHLYRMLFGLVKGNLDALSAVRRHDVLYVPNMFAAFYTILPMLYCRLKGARVIYHFHDLIAKKSLSLRLVTLLVTDFVHNAELSRDEVIKANSFIRTRRNWIIPYPIGSRSNIAQEHSLNTLGDARNILFVGQVAKHKGVDLLLDAFALLRTSHLNVTLNVVGGCDEPDLMKRLGPASEKKNGWIKYWGYREDVLEMMKTADVYVHPTPPSRFHESFGRGVVEAMSVGTPTVCFKSGALQEIVTDGQNGLVCSDETAECLADNISRLLNDHGLRNQCGRLARKLYESNYSDARVKSLWLELLGSHS
jgi:glycosyltransferase involved in cell wall biosynthesis